MNIMAKKLYVANEPVEDARLSADLAAAQGFDKVRVGKLGVYFVKLLKTTFYPYESITRAFVRIYEGTARLCCGSPGTNYTCLVLELSDGSFAEAYTESEKAMHSALRAIQENAPEVIVGAEF